MAGCRLESHRPGIGRPFLTNTKNMPLGSPRSPPRAPRAPRAPQRRPNGTPKGAKWSPKATNWTPRGAKWTPKGTKWSPKSRQGKPKALQRHQKEAKGTSYIFTNSRSTAKAAVMLLNVYISATHTRSNSFVIIFA